MCVIQLFHPNQNTITSGGRIRRLLENTDRFSSCEAHADVAFLVLREQREPKTPEEAFFASEEAKAVPAESEGCEPERSAELLPLSS